MERVWAETAAVYDDGGDRRPSAAGVDYRILRSLAVTGGPGLEAARGQRVAAIRRRRSWAIRSDARVSAPTTPRDLAPLHDRGQAAETVAAAERALFALCVRTTRRERAAGDDRGPVTRHGRRRASKQRR